MNKIFDVKQVRGDNNYLYLTVDGKDYQIAWRDCSPKLAAATSTERDYIDISPSGYGLHWPLLDEDLAIRPFLQQAEPMNDRKPAFS
jgi:hypothetical protein